MDNFGGARIAPATPDELSEEEQAKVKREGLNAFMSQWNAPVNSGMLVNARHQCRLNLHAAQRLMKAQVDGLVTALAGDNLLDDDEIQIISEHLYRMLSDADSASDKVLAVHDEIISHINLNEILGRYKG